VGAILRLNSACILHRRQSVKNGAAECMQRRVKMQCRVRENAVQTVCSAREKSLSLSLSGQFSFSSDAPPFRSQLVGHFLPASGQPSCAL